MPFRAHFHGSRSPTLGRAGAERLFHNLLPVSPAEPGHRSQKSAPGDEAGNIPDLDGMGQDAELGEDVVPVVVGLVGDCAYCHQRQVAGNGVAHVYGDSGEAVEEGEDTEYRSGKLLLRGKIKSQQSRYQELEDGAAPEVERLAEITKEEMAAFMDRQMRIVEQRHLPEVAREKDQKQRVESHPAVKFRARDGLPFDFRELHGEKLTAKAH